MLKALLLAAAVCMDAFFAAIGCGMHGIEIPKRCAGLIGAIGAGFLMLSMLCGELLRMVIPGNVLRLLGAAILMLMGLSQLLKGVLAAWFRKRPGIRWRTLGLVIDICFDETKADVDHSKTLSISEAAAYAAALSADSLASGVGAGIAHAWMVPCLCLTLVMGYCLTLIGCRIGQRSIDGKRMAWIGGSLLVLLGILRLFPIGT